MRIIRPDQMAEIDARTAEEFHIPGMLLMENAGLKGFLRFLEVCAAAESSSAASPSGKDARFVFVAGGGHNGGDALVMARQAHLLLPEARVEVLCVKRKFGELPGLHASSVEALGLPVTVWDEDERKAERVLEEADFIFDGIAGTGMKGALRPPLDSLVQKINRTGEEKRDDAYRIVAIDVPSGIGPDFREGMPAVRADLTLTMGLPKTILFGLDARPYCGRIDVIELGFPPALVDVPTDSGELVDGVEPLETGRRAYKGTRGHTAVFAGAIGTTGAAGLSAKAAAGAGSGLVTVYCDDDLYGFYAGKAEGVMVKKLPKQLSTLSERHSAIVAGPGWGEGRGELLLNLVESGLPGVADADALGAFAELRTGGRAKEAGYDFWAGRWVLTPHPGEFALISDVSKERLFSDPISVVKETAEALNAVVMLKAHVVFAAAPDGRYAVIDGMNPAMGTGGSGDVLAGTIGGLLAGGLEVFEAASRAAAAHQAAGQQIAARSGWFNAESLPGEIASLLWRGSDPGTAAPADCGAMSRLWSHTVTRERE